MSPIHEALRILIVEDEAIIAMNLEDMVIQLGYYVIAIATRIDKALQLADKEEFNLALLDINLAGVTTFPVAAVLRKRTIPFIFTSGYGQLGLKDDYCGAPLLTKPFNSRELERVISQVLPRDIT